MTDLIAVHISRENNLHLQSLAKKNNCTVDDLINEAVCEYYADEIRQVDTPQTDYEKGLQEFADILFDKDKQDQFLKECKAMGIEPQTDCPWK